MVLQFLIPAREDIKNSGKLYYMKDKIGCIGYLIFNH